VNFPAKTLQARRKRDDIFKVLKEKNKTKQTNKQKKTCPPRILYQAKLFFRIEGQIDFPR